MFGFFHKRKVYICSSFAQSLTGETGRHALRAPGQAQLLRMHRRDRLACKEELLEPQVLEKLTGYALCAATNLYWDELKATQIDNKTILQVKAELATEAQTQAYRYAKLMERHKATGALIFQGRILEDAVMRHLAIERDLDVVCLERTLRMDKLVWDSVSGITVNIGEGALRYYRWRDHIRPEEAELTARIYLQNLKSLKQTEHANPSKPFQWKTDKPKILFLGQVYTDSSLLYGLTGFSNPVDVIRSVMKWATDSQASLIVKLHPKENNGCNPITQEPYNNLTYRKIQSKAGDEVAALGDDIVIDYDNTFDTHQLIRQSDLVITINSQAGLEAAIMGKPVIHGRGCFYGGYGFTHEFGNAADISSKLSDALNEGAPDPTAAKLFFHIFFEKFCIDSSPAAIKKLLRIL